MRWNEMKWDETKERCPMLLIIAAEQDLLYTPRFGSSMNRERSYQNVAFKRQGHAAQPNVGDYSSAKNINDMSQGLSKKNR